MSLISNYKYYISFDKSKITEFPFKENQSYEMSEYLIEKYSFSEGKNFVKEKRYSMIEFKDDNKDKKESLNHFENYVPYKKGTYDINGESFCFQNNKINIIIFITNNENKINDMNKLLFYLINNCLNNIKSISFTTIVCDLKDGKNGSQCYFHDKPYHLYEEYSSGHKEEFEKCIKIISNICKLYSMNLNEGTTYTLLKDLNICTLFLPQFLIYDNNYHILYHDNLFQETPERLKEICKNINSYIEKFDGVQSINSLMTKCPIEVQTFFDKCERNILANKIYNNENEFNQEKEKLINLIKNQFQKEENKDKSYQIYFIKKFQNLTKEQLESDLSKDSNVKILYLKPIVSFKSNKEYSFPFFLFNNDNDFDYISSPKKLNNNLNNLLNYTWKCALSFCENNKINNSEMQLKSIKTISNIALSKKFEFNVLYNGGIDNYSILLNFKSLFRDKSKYFSINLAPNLIPSQKYKLRCKDSKTREKEAKIKEEQITIFQYFSENLYADQYDLGETINKLKEENPKMKFKYYIVILISGDKIQNSVNYDKLKEFFKICSNVNNILIYTYSIDEFRELTKYLAAGPGIYVFGPKKEMAYFELTHDKEKTKDMLLFYVNKFLTESYEKNITKEQYKLLKDLSKDILGLNKLYSNQKIIEIELSKIKYFNSNEKNYIFKLYNYLKKINNEKDVEQKQEVIDLEKRVKDILSLNEGNLSSSPNQKDEINV
jgi:hypothetical protein